MRKRGLCCVATLTAGVVLIVLGYLLSAPRGQPDPVLDFAPLLFITGLMLSFASAAVYELAGGR